MSLTTWKATYYPISARETAPQDAIAHSLTKWRGLLDLASHGLTRAHSGSICIGDITDDAQLFPISGGTCALCVHFYDDDDDIDEFARCARCPLALSRGGVPCTKATTAEGTYSPFERWTLNGDPAPMIHALETALEDNLIATRTQEPR